jgi:RNA polymerase sigma-70 factor (ECF subfamily)
MDVLQNAYAAHASRVARQIYLIVGDEELAGEAVNEAFARAGYDWESAAGNGAAESLIRAEALRLVTGPWGRLRTALQRRDAYDDEHGGHEHSADMNLFRALQALPEHHRIAMVLHHVAGLDPDGVAAESESTIGAAIARIERAETELARTVTPRGKQFEYGELTDRLQELAEHARVPLLMPHLAAQLPERRMRRTVTAVVSAAAGLLFVLVAAAWMSGGGEAPTDYAAESAAEAVPRETPTGTPSPTPPAETEEPPPPTQTSAAVLPTRESAPNVAPATQDGRDFGFARDAFVHGGTTYLSLDRAQLRSGRISNVSSLLRTFAVAEDAAVSPGSRLSGAFGGRTIGREEFLRLVAGGDIDDVPLTIRYDESGKVVEISEYESG